MGETPLNHWRSVDIALLVLLCRLGPHDEVLLEKILNPQIAHSASVESMQSN